MNKRLHGALLTGQFQEKKILTLFQWLAADNSSMDIIIQLFQKNTGGDLILVEEKVWESKKMSSDPGETLALSGGSPTDPKRHQQRQRRQQQRCRPTCGCLMITVAFTLLGTAVINRDLLIFVDVNPDPHFWNAGAIGLHIYWLLGKDRLQRQFDWRHRPSQQRHSSAYVAL